VAGRICRWFAVIGGVVLVAMTLMSVASIVGRSLFGKPVPAISSWSRSVAPFAWPHSFPGARCRAATSLSIFFTTRASARTQAWLDVFGALLLAAVMLLVAWRTGVGAVAVKASGETSMIMGFPSWIGYAFMAPGFALTALAALYTAFAAWRGGCMSGLGVGLTMFGGMLVLMALRVPIAISMFVPGALGYVALAGDTALLNQLKGLAYARTPGYDLSVIPLFLLMGEFATKGGLSRSLFKCGNALLGHFRGGMAMAAILACAAFGAVCGSSVCDRRDHGQVALPEMRRYNYSGGFATATLAAGGTLGILIPPSVVLVVYAILTEQNIAKLFAAAFIPGFIARPVTWRRLRSTCACTRATAGAAAPQQSRVARQPGRRLAGGGDIRRGVRRHLRRRLHPDRRRRGGRSEHFFSPRSPSGKWMARRSNAASTARRRPPA